MSILIEQNFSDIQTISESINGEKSWYINGVFAQGNVINGNRRFYPSEVLTESFDRYRSLVESGRAVGELNHPPTLEINPERISQKIESIVLEGDSYVGRAKVLNTPCGRIIQGLLEGNVKIGVSTRAGGTVKDSPKGYKIVESGLSMRAVDTVWNPSAPDAFVDGLMESDSCIWNTMNMNPEFLEEIKNDIKYTSKNMLQEAKILAFNKLITNIQTHTLTNK